MKVLLVIGSGTEWGFLMPLFSLFRAAWSPLLSLCPPPQVCGNRYQTETPAVTLTAPPPAERGEN